MALKPRKMTESRPLQKRVDVQSHHQVQGEYAPLDFANPNLPFLEGTFMDEAADQGANGDTLKQMTPLYMKILTGGLRQWAPWIDGQLIQAFCLGLDGYSSHEERAMQLDRTDSSMGLVLMDGIIPADQIPVPAGQTRANMEAALRDGMRSASFHITNLAGVS